MSRSPSTPMPLAVPAASGPAIPAARAHIDIRPLRTMAECNACVELQRQVWGFDQSETVPATLLHVVDFVGGLAAGAFDESDQLVGFVFGVSGMRDGELVHWSHMLAVRESARNLGLGRMLKEHQREVMASHGIRRMFWSFDPLMAKNAYFNFNRLGASVVEYVRDMYGTTASPLHLGLPTDRLVVTTPTTAADSERSLPTDDVLPVLTPFPQRGDDLMAIGERRPDALMIEVPSDILEITRRSLATARQWRLAVREHFEWALSNDYRVASVRRNAPSDREFYVLLRQRAA
ncbi:MAG TPA: GNAT family N-acetyltransferase [Vicinamibacterales bacterium]|nr:GNAT family N-acetyltransferase [Vicinamibacterales bacterium]